MNKRKNLDLTLTQKKELEQIGKIYQDNIYLKGVIDENGKVIDSSKNPNNLPYLVHKSGLEIKQLNGEISSAIVSQIFKFENTIKNNNFSKRMRDWIDELHNILRNELPCYVSFKIVCRQKSWESFLRKVLKNYFEGISINLFDILALRIIIYSNMPEKDLIRYCYITLKCCISYFQNQLCTILPPAKKIGNNLLYKDYIEEPKANGYKSIHLAFMDLENEAFELQIRTDEMNKRAEYDLEANHHAYKNFEYSDIFPYINFDVKKVNIPGFSIHVCKDPETEKEIVHIEDDIGLKYAKDIEKRVKTYSI